MSTQPAWGPAITKGGLLTDPGFVNPRASFHEDEAFNNIARILSRKHFWTGDLYSDYMADPFIKFNCSPLFGETSCEYWGQGDSAGVGAFLFQVLSKPLMVQNIALFREHTDKSGNKCNYSIAVEMGPRESRTVHLTGGMTNYNGEGEFALDLVLNSCFFLMRILPAKQSVTMMEFQLLKPELVNPNNLKAEWE